MKKYPFEVIYLNGNEELFYCQTYEQAVILALAHAIQMGWDMRIKYIADENGILMPKSKRAEEHWNGFISNQLTK